jgi:hypothetical protein
VQSIDLRAIHGAAGALLTSLLIFAAACGGGASSSQCPDDPGPARRLTESCCPTHGADACGAGLFCAAFDGRTVPVCYAERTRDDLASCTGDVQCRSNSCNHDAGVCRTLTPGDGTCSADVGCVDPSGTLLACLDTGAGHACTETHGGPNDPCNADKDCNASLGLHCDLADFTCTYATEGQCTYDFECGGEYRCKLVSQLGYKACVSVDSLPPSDPACAALACAMSLCWHECYSNDDTGEMYCSPLTCDPPM